MTDVLTPEQRHRNMAAIRSKNTKPEMIVRRTVHGLRFRFRLHQKSLPGKPDLTLARHRKVIFVHGCFWHMHTCKHGCVIPKTDTKYWHAKLLANVKRDRENVRVIRKAGWQTLTVWECETKNLQKLRTQLLRFLVEH